MDFSTKQESEILWIFVAFNVFRTTVAHGTKGIIYTVLVAAWLISPKICSANATGDFEIMAFTGQQAIGAPEGVLISKLGAPGINDSGDIAYLAELQSIGFRAGIWVNQTPVVVSNDPVPGMSGVLFSNMRWVTFNNAGSVAYKGETNISRSGIWKDLSLVAFENHPAPQIANALFRTLDERPIITESGGVGFRASVNYSVAPFESADTLYFDAQPTAITGTQAHELPTGVLFRSLGSIDVNAAGELSYHAFLEEGVGGTTSLNRRGVWLDKRNLLRAGDLVPGSSTLIIDALSAPAVNNKGDVLFSVALRHGVGGVDESNDRILLLNNHQVLREGEQIPGTPAGSVYESIQWINLSENGSIGWLVRMKEGPGGITADDNDFLFRDGTLVAREGDQAPGFPTGVTYRGFGTVIPISGKGHLGFRATLFNATPNFAIFISGPNGQTLPLLDEDGLLAGHPVTSAFFKTNLNHGERSLNENSQFAFHAYSATGEQFVAKFTPYINWRLIGSGNWTESSNWTLSQRPSFMHRVFIDPDIDVDVQLNSSDVVVKQLNIGNGAGSTLLALNSRSLTVETSLVIGANGTIASGNITADSLHHQGLISLQTGHTVSVNGEFINDGTIAGSGLLRVLGTLKDTGISTFHYDGELEFGPSSIVEIELTKNVNELQSDVISSNGNIAFGGTLKLLTLPGYIPTSGDTFSIFETQSVSGEFADIDFTEAYLPPSLEWDTSQLYQSGVISTKEKTSVNQIPLFNTMTWLILALIFSMIGIVRVNRSAEG